MQSNTAKNQPKGFTQIPNAIIDNPSLCLRDKMILIKLARHAYGEKRAVYPSQKAIAKSLDIRRETAKAALKSLASLGVIVPHGKGRKGKQETFTLDLDRAANLTGESSPNPAYSVGTNLPTQSASPAESVDTKHTAESDEPEKKASPASTSAIRGCVEPEDSHGVEDRDACFAQHEGPADSVGRFTKRQINDLMLTPDGKIACDDYDDLDYMVNSLTLPMLGREWLKGEELPKLVELRGVRFCRFWIEWLPRKVAWYYVKGEPVNNPSGLYRRAVEQGWEVDPSWPEFDESKHTEAARDSIYDDAIPF